MRTRFSKRLVASGLIAAIGANLVLTGPAFADSDRDRGRDRDRHYTRHDARQHDDRRYGHSGRDDHRSRSRAPHAPAPQARRGRSDGHHYGPPRAPVVVHRRVVRTRPVVRSDYYPHHAYYRPAPRVVVVPERRHYRNVWVVRPYGHRYYGYGHFARDDDAYPWLAFTAISVALISALTEDQQRVYEDAQIRATTAPIGQTIVWNDGDAAGSVVATRDGTSSTGRYCREFQQTVTVGGRTEQAYGTACMQPDGAWQIVQAPHY